MATIDSAIGLREAFEKDKNGVYATDNYAADVIAAAVLLKQRFLKDLKESAKIVEAADDFFKTIAHADEAGQAYAILGEKCEALIELGENESALAIAQKMIDADPKGPSGMRGQVLQAQLIKGGSGAEITVDRKLAIANQQAGQGEYEQALAMCREVVLRSADPENHKYAAQAMLMTGAIYATRQWFHEASVAFDAVVRRFPKSEAAPDALWRSIRCFLELEDSDGGNQFKRLKDERIAQLVREYPTDPHVAELQLLEGDQLARQKKLQPKSTPIAT
jgi:tetratricopeptide (TPR) repeat protein